MRPVHAQTCDVPVLHAVRGLLLHLRQYISHDLRRVVGCPWRPGDVHGDVGERGPGERMVQVVFEEVVLREVGEVRLLHVGDVGGPEDTDVHFV